jgi:flagellar hook protein FlgE
MASTTALFTGLSGLTANSRQLDTIGNNIANVNTTAFKSNRMLFAPTFSRNFSLGTAPSDTTGGTNPGQIGLGISIAGTQRNFNNGSISTTGVSTDVAIEGDGFFVVSQAGEQIYTRSGAFQLNQDNDLVTLTGAKVLGYAVDEQLNLVEGNLVEMNIPVGTMTLAESTRNVTFNGNLNASGPVASGGSEHATRTFFIDDDGDPTTPPALPETPATDVADLTSGADHLWIEDGAGGHFLALESGADAIVTVSGIEKGGKDLGTHSFQFTAGAPAPGVEATGAQMSDFIQWLEDVLGLDDTPIPPSNHSLGGNIVMNANGQIVITGNEGTVQDLAIDTADITVTYPGATVGSPINQPFVMTKSGDADGESVRTSFVVYDSLGTPITVDLTFVLQETIDGSGTTWEFIAESSDNDDPNRIVGLGVVTFDANGRYVEATNQSIQIIRGNGSVSPLTVNFVFDNGTDAISGLTDTASNLAAVSQDGSPIGTLSSFSIGEDGVLNGSFTNGLTRVVGGIALAKFSNPEGLVDAGNSMFRVGPNSGNPLVTSPLEFGTGRVLGGALELSNVDLSQEFINMILASTGYSASSRIITTTDELMDQLLLLGR